MGDWTDGIVRQMGGQPPVSVRLAEVIRTSPCLPFNVSEVETLGGYVDAFSTSQVVIDLRPWRTALLLEDDWFGRLVHMGLIYVSASHVWPVVCAIVKVDAGRGFFGRQRVAYHVFASLDDEDNAPDQFIRGPVCATPAEAFKAAMAFFRIAATVKRRVEEAFRDP